MSHDGNSGQPLTRADRHKPADGPKFIPPPKVDMNAKRRREARKIALEMCEETCNAGQYLLFGFRIEPDGSVGVAYRMQYFPFDRMDDVGELIALAIANEMRKSGIEVPAALAEATQNSEPVPAPVPESVPASLPEEENGIIPLPSVPGMSPEQMMDAAKTPGVYPTPGEDPQDYTQ